MSRGRGPEVYSLFFPIVRSSHIFFLRSLILVRDLLNLPRKRTSSILCHPLLTTFIDQHWLRTRWLFLLSFTLYLIFVLLFTLFLGMMYERNNDPNEVIRIPVELPQSCDALRPVDLSSKKENGILNRMLINDDSELIDVTAGNDSPDLVNRAGIKKKAGRNDGEYQIKLEVVKEKKNKTKISRVRRKEGLFMECSTRRRFQDIPLCVVETFLGKLDKYFHPESFRGGFI